MALNPSDVAKIAQLARLDIDDSDTQVYADRLGNILDMVAQLQAVDTDGIEPMAHPMDATQRLRDDVVTETNKRDAYQAIAPTTEDGLYLVPRVIE